MSRSFARHGRRQACATRENKTQQKMAPEYRAIVKISWCSTLSISVLVNRMEESSYLRRLSLRSLLTNFSSTKGRMDPAGFELEALTRRLSRVPKS